MTLTVVSYCVEPDCRCEHRAGVVEYRGDDHAEADAALAGRFYPVAVVEYEE